MMKSTTANPNLAYVLDQHTTVGELWHHEDERIRCVACGHRCLIGEGKRGICKVRFNDAGKLMVPFGYVAGLQCDPVEKKPFFHVYPGSDALTFGMMGCDLHCSYCQNWVTSQALRDPSAAAATRVVTPAQLIETALRERARLMVSSYNEPLITAEWAVAVFEQAKAAGLACAFVSNGNATPEVLAYLAPWICAYKVDLKSFDDHHYRTLGGTLSNILDTIRMIHERRIWLEIVTLVIPGFNDSEHELREIARFLASISRDIPWHVTAFHKDYRMTDPDATSPRLLMRAAEIGAEAGLRYVYAGNLPGQVGACENTRCPGCGNAVIERYGYLIRSYRLTADGRCSHCQSALPGIWSDQPAAVRTGNDKAAYAQRLPRPLAVLTTPQISNQVVMEKSPMNQRPELTGQEKQLLVAATGTLVRDLVLARGAAFADPSLGGLGGQQVAGAFVSLKRGKHLRSCCGMLGKPIPLRVALQESAARTVSEDERFPPISPTEIDYLDMEVWLLHTPEPVQARGADRAEAVTIGKHGVQVVRGSQHGLFLPSVALEQKWDRQRFLNQVCIKAGLHPTAWQEDATTLYTFEGEVLHSRLADTANGDAVSGRRPGICQPEGVQAYADFCRDNINALFAGAMPSFFFVGAADGDVNGVILTLSGLPATTRDAPLTSHDADGSTSVHFCQISLRPGVPLQSTLFMLSQNAAQVLGRQRQASEMLAAARVRVTILHDPTLHGTARDPELAGINPRERAILVLEGNKSAIVFDPARSTAELLAEAVKQARVTRPASAAVFSLDALALSPLTLSIAPRPVRGPAERPPGAAGGFYPADADKLASMVDDLLTGERGEETWSAAMVPHAGLIYSGRIAANVLKRLRIPRTVIILGPKHTALGVEWAVAPHQTWTFPGGSIESDFLLARQLCEAIPGLELDSLAHQREHAIEVELPFLARLAPQSRVVGLAIGAADLESCQRFARGLASVLKDREERPLLLISSDMNHYAPDTQNRRLDAMAIEALERLDPTALYETVTENQISMCGLVPAVIVLETLRLLGGLKRAERFGYATSADVNGDATRVVGYAGMLFN